MGKKKRKGSDADVAATPDAIGGGAEVSADPEAEHQLLPPPISDAPLAFDDLPADFLGAFFELCFPDRRLLELCRELSLTAPGYRLEALPPDQIARLLADEALAAKDARALLERAVREALRSPALESARLTVDQLAELLDLQVDGDPLQHVARIAWGALNLGEAGRPLALDCIEDGLAMLEPAEKGAAKKPVRPPPPDARQAEEAIKRAERAEKERAAMREQLAAARAEMAAREQRLAEQGRELTQLQASQARLSAEVARLLGAGEGRALADARRATDEARSLAEKLRVSEEELRAAEQRARDAEQRLRTAVAVVPATAAQLPEDELPSDDEASSFLIPVLTREFYDSIDRWSRRMQRAAFDKIHLLAHDWRHGSLRALPLEGVPGYYRIRVATDVRLMYRRDGAQLEILSLIDREDLDRYIRQARTRPA